MTTAVQTKKEPLLSKDEFLAALPPQIQKRGLSQEVITGVTQLLSDPDMAESYRDNLLGYTSVMNEGKFKLTSYVKAVQYVTQKLSGKTNQDAYQATFPDKWNDWLARNVSPKDISSYVSIYNGSQLVNKILEQSLIPNWVLNQDVRQKAINHLASLMVSAQSEKVQCDAANALLTHLKMPDKLKVELDAGPQVGGVMDELRKQTTALAGMMQDAVKAGVMSAKDAAERPLIIEGVAERV